MYGVCVPTLRKSLVKWPCQKKVMRSANGVGVVSMWSSHHDWSAVTLIGLSCVAASAPARSLGSAGGVSTSLSTVFAKPSFTAASYCAFVIPNVARRRSCATWASGLSSGLTQSFVLTVGVGIGGLHERERIGSDLVQAEDPRHREPAGRDARADDDGPPAQAARGMLRGPCRARAFRRLLGRGNGGRNLLVLHRCHCYRIRGSPGCGNSVQRRKDPVK